MEDSMPKKLYCSNVVSKALFEPRRKCLLALRKGEKLKLILTFLWGLAPLQSLYQIESRKIIQQIRDGSAHQAILELAQGHEECCI
jgi:hypothetical protein